MLRFNMIDLNFSVDSRGITVTGWYRKDQTYYNFHRILPDWGSVNSFLGTYRLLEHYGNFSDASKEYWGITE